MFTNRCLLSTDDSAVPSGPVAVPSEQSSAPARAPLMRQQRAAMMPALWAEQTQTPPLLSSPPCHPPSPPPAPALTAGGLPGSPPAVGRMPPADPGPVAVCQPPAPLEMLHRRLAPASGTQRRRHCIARARPDRGGGCPGCRGAGGRPRHWG